MPYGEWPAMTVHDWNTAWAKRDPEWGAEEGDRDGIDTASETKRLHELRGVIIGQVAEIESLLLHMTSKIERKLPEISVSRGYRNRGTGAVLQALEEQLRQLGIAAELHNQFVAVRNCIRERNNIVHATVRIHYSWDPFSGGRAAVLEIWLDNKGIDKVPVENEDGEGDSSYFERSTIDLERQLAGAYDALERCIDIWERVESALAE
jgi:hypothetical protein